MTGLRAVPPVVWIGVAFALIGLWGQDVRALYVAGVCAVIGIVQIALRD